MIPAHIRSEIQRAVDGARYEANVVAEVQGVGLESSTLFKLAAHLQEVLDRDESEHAAEVAGGYGGRRKLTDYLPEDERPTDVEMNQLRAYWLTGRGSESFASVQRQAESQIGTEMHKLVEKLRDRVDQQISEQIQALPEQQRTWLRARWEQGEVELTTAVDPVDFTSNSYSMTVELRPKMMHDFATIYGRHSTFHEAPPPEVEALWESQNREYPPCPDCDGGSIPNGTCVPDRCTTCAGEGVLTDQPPITSECALCHQQAEGLATIGDARYCHGDTDEVTCYQRAQQTQDVGLDIFAAAFTEPEMTVLGKNHLGPYRGTNPHAEHLHVEVPDPPFDHPHEFWAFNCVLRSGNPPNGVVPSELWCLACSGGDRPGWIG